MSSAVVDIVDATMADCVDYVDRIYGGNHEKWCNYVPSVNSKGLIYCDTCLSQIGSIAPPSSQVPFAEYERNFDAFGPGIKHQVYEGEDLTGKMAPDTLGKRRRRV